MKPDELMIGDWVKYGKYSMKITELAEDMCFDDIEPILLTPEILKKNGFGVVRNISSSRNKDIWILRVSEHKMFCITEYHNKKKFPYFWIEMGSNTDIKYVHQLQQALRLCKIKKTIEL
jgi:hypothetical protein